MARVRRGRIRPPAGRQLAQAHTCRRRRVGQASLTQECTVDRRLFVYGTLAPVSRTSMCWPVCPASGSPHRSGASCCRSVGVPRSASRASSSTNGVLRYPGSCSARRTCPGTGSASTSSRRWLWPGADHNHAPGWKHRRRVHLRCPRNYWHPSRSWFDAQVTDGLSERPWLTSAEPDCAGTPAPRYDQSIPHKQRSEVQVLLGHFSTTWSARQ